MTAIAGRNHPGLTVMALFGTRLLVEHHVAECSERYRAAAIEFRELRAEVAAERERSEKAVNAIYRMLWTVALATIGGLATSLATLVLKLLHP